MAMQIVTARCPLFKQTASGVMLLTRWSAAAGIQLCPLSRAFLFTFNLSVEFPVLEAN